MIVLTAVVIATVVVRNQASDENVLMTAGCFSATPPSRSNCRFIAARSGNLRGMSHRVNGLLSTMYSAKDAAVSAAYLAAAFLAGADDAALGDVRFR